MNSRIAAKNITKEFTKNNFLFLKPTSNVVFENMNFELNSGNIVGLAGKSGIGKTTLAKVLAGLLPPTRGQVFIDGIPIYDSKTKGYKQARRDIRFIFQNVNAPLNPNIKIRSILDEPLKIHTKLTYEEREKRVKEVIEQLDMPTRLLAEYPRCLSGGEKRRVGLARAMVVKPQFIIADEPTAGIDADLQNSVLELFLKLKRDENLGILIISHDSHVLENYCDKIITMNGRC